VDTEEDFGPPDTDGVDEDEYAKWKVRELKRIKREKEEREQCVRFLLLLSKRADPVLGRFARDRAETERRRAMTDAERMEEDRKLGKFDTKPKAKWNFLQRYYHKGAFYQNDETVTKKADEVADAPTLGDRIDKSMLPKVLQVKNFGRPSRTKWTHLLAEDTTQQQKQPR
jgi:microfibrillar-associated protein 1